MPFLAKPKSERGEYPQEPAPAKRLIVSDITIEAVAVKLEENPHGLLLYRDELDGFFGDMGKYNSGKDEPHYITIHNGSILTIDRKGNGLINVPRPCLSIIGGIQPTILKQRLAENLNYFHSGFIARFLIAMPPFEAVRDNDNEIEDAVLHRWETLLKYLRINRKLQEQDGKVIPVIYSLSADASNVFRQYQHRHADLQEYETDGLATVEGKFATNCLRLALNLHVVKLSESAKADFTAPVSGETMRSACVIAEWFVNEAKRIYGHFAGEPVAGELSPEQREVLKVLQKADAPLTIREMKRHSRPLQRMENIETILAELIKIQRVRDNFTNSNNTSIRYEISRVAAAAADSKSAEYGEFAPTVNVNTGNTKKNENSGVPLPAGAFDDFADYQNAGSINECENNADDSRQTA
ncbi:hypothetical protein FACS189427_10640 [Planctomycetales bacterium]|nr:hypothetical protein FACS189427_10640 [Planctomycetales bacterium]